ncbi:MAG: hypothetical protein ABGZ17_03260, partial [Planctomycetaceae bacterium]
MPDQHLHKTPPIRHVPTARPPARSGAWPTSVERCVRALTPIIAFAGLIAGLGWTRPPTPSGVPQRARQLASVSRRGQRPAEQRPAAIVVRQETCRVLLRSQATVRGEPTATATEDYGLLIGSLGTFRQTFQVTLTREPTGVTDPHGAVATGTPLGQLPVNDPHRLPLNAVPRSDLEPASWLRQRLVRDVGFRQPGTGDTTPARIASAATEDSQRTFYLHVTDGPLGDP